MKLAISEACLGHGRCYSLAPDLLESDDEGYVAIRGAAIEWPSDRRALAEELVGTCPEGAISIEVPSGT